MTGSGFRRKRKQFSEKLLVRTLLIHPSAFILVHCARTHHAVAFVTRHSFSGGGSATKADLLSTFCGFVCSHLVALTVSSYAFIVQRLYGTIYYCPCSA